MLESAVLTFGLLRIQLHFTCSATLFRSFEVRACCASAVDFTGKNVVSVFVVFKIEVARDFYLTKLSKESALPGVFVDFSVVRGELPPPRYGCRRLLASPRGIKLSLCTCRSNSVVSFHFTQTFPEKVLVLKFSNHALLKSFAQRKKQSLPDVRLHLGSSIDRSIDPERARCHTTKPADRFVDSFRSTPNCSHHKQLARLTSLSFVRVGNVSRF